MFGFFRKLKARVELLENGFATLIQQRAIEATALSETLDSLRVQATSAKVLQDCSERFTTNELKIRSFDGSKIAAVIRGVETGVEFEMYDGQECLIVRLRVENGIGALTFFDHTKNPPGSRTYTGRLT